MAIVVETRIVGGVFCLAAVEGRGLRFTASSENKSSKSSDLESTFVEQNKLLSNVTVTLAAPFFELDILFSIWLVGCDVGFVLGGRDDRKSSSNTTVFLFCDSEVVGGETARLGSLIGLGTVVEAVKSPLSSSLPDEVGLSEKRSELLSDRLPDARRVRLEGGRLAAPFALFCDVCVCVCVRCVRVCVYVCVHLQYELSEHLDTAYMSS